MVMFVSLPERPSLISREPGRLHSVRLTSKARYDGHAGLADTATPGHPGDVPSAALHCLRARQLELCHVWTLDASRDPDCMAPRLPNAACIACEKPTAWQPNYRTPLLCLHWKCAGAVRGPKSSSGYDSRLSHYVTQRLMSHHFNHGVERYSAVEALRAI